MNQVADIQVNNSRLTQNLIQLYTITNKEVTRFMRIWVQTILPPVITTALYFLIFGRLIGSNIPAIQGFKYMDFIVPGLIMMSVINNAFLNVVSSFFSAKFLRHIEELLVSPTPNLVILTGYLVGGVLRGVMVGFLVAVIAACFTTMHIQHPVFMVVTVLLTSLLFSIGGFINAMFAKKFDDISIIPTFVLQPLTYLGGIFYSIHMLPSFWQTVSMFNPILYMINIFRYSFLGISDIDIPLAFAVIVGLTLILFIVALNMLSSGRGLRS